jgi:hypothetical protein
MGIYRQAGCVCAHPEHREKLALSCMLCKCGDWRGPTCTSVIEMREKSMREEIKAGSIWIGKGFDSRVTVVTTTALSVIYADGKGEELLDTTRDFLDNYRKSGFEVGKTYKFKGGQMPDCTYTINSVGEQLVLTTKTQTSPFDLRPGHFQSMTEV